MPNVVLQPQQQTAAQAAFVVHGSHSSHSSHGCFHGSHSSNAAALRTGVETATSPAGQPTGTAGDGEAEPAELLGLIELALAGTAAEVDAEAAELLGKTELALAGTAAEGDAEAEAAEAHGKNEVAVGPSAGSVAAAPELPSECGTTAHAHLVQPCAGLGANPCPLTAEGSSAGLDAR